ncbi:hypothetical protein ACH3Y9_12430 [Streptomyces sp. WSLK1-5]
MTIHEMSHVLADKSSAEPFLTLEDRWRQEWAKGHVEPFRVR